MKDVLINTSSFHLALPSKQSFPSITSDEPEFKYLKSLTTVAGPIPFPILHDDDDINNKNIKLRVEASAVHAGVKRVLVGAWLSQKF